ncbi:polyamine aminopropyltransferase [bacterium]|nr:polyamine aminopropyltransferase [bacterium]MBU1651064.1 polyamine aminopropyltransferase [bacterium]
MDWFKEITENATGVLYRITKKLHESQSQYQKVEMFETAAFGKLLALDGAVMLTEAHEFIYHDMLVHIPMLSHPEPKRVLIVGGGDGGTAREVLKHRTVETVDMVEIDVEVVEVSKRYLADLACKLDDPKLNLYIQDAIEFVHDKEDIYDVVLVDSTDPIGPGEGLFNRSFYRDVFNILKPDGIVAVQSESPFLLGREVPQIFTKLQSVFPLTRLYWAPMPCYPYGTWTFTYCSKSGMEPIIRRTDEAEEIEDECKYYNRKIHQASFVLPNFIRKLTEGAN